MATRSRNGSTPNIQRRPPRTAAEDENLSQVRSFGPSAGQIGTTGLEQYGGYIFDRYNPSLTGDAWKRIVRDMVDNDPIIGSILFSIEMLLRQVSWKVAPSDSSPESERQAAFVQECFDDMSFSWVDIMSEILTMLPWGYAYLEVIYKLRNGSHPDDPTQDSRFNDGQIGWRKWANRAQETTLRWEFDQNGGIAGMWQLAPPRWQTNLIPIQKALLFRTTTRLNNPEGRSVLRNAYRPWYFKRNIEQIEGIGIERDLAGIPIAWVPPKIMSPTASTDDAAIYAQVLQLVTNIRRDEQEGIVFPLLYDEAGHKLYDLTLLSSGGSRQFNTDAIIQRYEQRIAMSALADFVLLGHEAVGSFALSSDKRELFSTALNAWLDVIANVVTTYAIPPLILLNGWDTTKSPRYEHGGVDRIDLTEMANLINILNEAGMPLFPDAKFESYIREQAEWPEASGTAIPGGFPAPPLDAGAGVPGATDQQITPSNAPPIPPPAAQPTRPPRAPRTAATPITVRRMPHAQ